MSFVILVVLSANGIQILYPIFLILFDTPPIIIRYFFFFFFE